MPKRKRKKTNKSKRRQSKGTAFEKSMDKLGSDIDKGIFGAADKFGKLVK